MEQPDPAHHPGGRHSHTGFRVRKTVFIADRSILSASPQPPDIIFRVEGRKILTDESTIKLKYVGRITDPNAYDTLLIETIAAALAADLAYPLVGSATLGANMNVFYQEKLKEARFVDATEDNQINTSDTSISQNFSADTFINSRL